MLCPNLPMFQSDQRGVPHLTLCHVLITCMMYSARYIGAAVRLEGVSLDLSTVNFAQIRCSDLRAGTNARCRFRAKDGAK